MTTEPGRPTKVPPEAQSAYIAEMPGHAKFVAQQEN